MDAATLPDDFRDLLVALADAGAEFLLVGGYALAAHGYLRATDDLDVFVRPTPANAERVFRGLAAFGAPVEAHGIESSVFAEEGYGYRMGVKPVCIEVLTSLTGIDFDDAWANHHFVAVDGRMVPVIGRAALLRNKRAAGRPKDLADVDWLEKHPPADEDASDEV